ncbi:hypothetical protein P4523_05290 [Bacillus toyonensis]|uniref:hypothetical protein n=1 Tax=Bacillus toyonensis TaxID=155322 RepID=UPI002E1A7883|nr:hypothetical protein [Bacillus toyonensis]
MTITTLTRLCSAIKITSIYKGSGLFTISTLAIPSSTSCFASLTCSEVIFANTSNFLSGFPAIAPNKETKSIPFASVPGIPTDKAFFITFLLAITFNFLILPFEYFFALAASYFNYYRNTVDKPLVEFMLKCFGPLNLMTNQFAIDNSYNSQVTDIFTNRLQELFVK